MAINKINRLAVATAPSEVANTAAAGIVQIV